MKSKAINFLVCFSLILLNSYSVLYAYSGGKTGSSNTGCVGCHGGSNNATTVFLREGNGPYSISTGDSKIFKVVVAHATMPKSGVNIAVKNSNNNNAGSFTSLTNCVSSDGELTHAAPVNMTGGETEYIFTWTAPSTPGVYTISAAGNAVNNDGGNGGDFWNLMSEIIINVQASPSITITSQNSPATYCKNAPINIMWNGVNLNGNTIIEMSPTGAAPWAQIGSVASTIITYQWTPISASFGISYRFRVINGTLLDTNDANVSILPTPVIATQLKAFDTICIGGNLLLSVMPDKEDPFLTYQWYKGNTAIQAANTRTYTIANAQAGSAGQYRVDLIGCSILSSIYCDVFVGQSPSITSHPNSSNACSGSQVILNVSANGTNLTYQWRKDGAAIPNANKAGYTISDMSANDAGNYDCVLTGKCTPSITSTIATVQMVQIPITSSNFSGADTSICNGKTLVFRANGTESTIARYIWKKNGNTLSTTDSTFTINSIASTDSGTYSVAAVNQCGQSGDERTIKLTVLTAPQIASITDDTTVFKDSETRLRIIALGSNLTYQWKKDGTVITNATSSVFIIASTQFADSGSYECIVSNSCDIVSSSKSYLNVLAAPEGPTISLLINNIDFGCVNKASSKDTVMNALIKNTGNAELYVSGITISGAASGRYSIISGNAPFVLATDESKTIGLRFSPQSDISNNATVTFTSNSVITPGKIDISGTSCFENIDITPIQLWIIANAKKDTTIKICNTGTKPAIVTEFTMIGSSTFSIIKTPALPLTIAPGKCTDIDIRFESSQNGKFNTNLLVTISQEMNASEIFTIPISATINNTAGLINGIDVSGISMYPNPAHNVLIIKAMQNIVSVKLVNMLGEFITEHTVNDSNTSISLESASISQGAYSVLIRLQNGDTYSLPLIIQQ